MIDLKKLNCDWFDRIYSQENSGRPTLEREVAMLRQLGVQYSDRQIRDFTLAIKEGLHLMKQECRPSLVLTTRVLVDGLGMSDQISLAEIEKYVSAYNRIIQRKHPHLQDGFE